VSSFSEKNVTI